MLLYTFCTAIITMEGKVRLTLLKNIKYSTKHSRDFSSQETLWVDENFIPKLKTSVEYVTFN